MVSIMETLRGHTEELPQNSSSDLDTEGQENLIENEHIAAQIEGLESKFDRNPDGSEKWGRFVDSPVQDQYGQLWMIWENSATSSCEPEDRYQVYKISDGEVSFKYAFIKDLKIIRYIDKKTSYEFFVGPDDEGAMETINVFFNDDGEIEYVHCYSFLKERKIMEEKYKIAREKLKLAEADPDSLKYWWRSRWRRN